MSKVFHFTVLNKWKKNNSGDEAIADNGAEHTFI